MSQGLDVIREMAEALRRITYSHGRCEYEAAVEDMAHLQQCINRYVAWVLDEEARACVREARKELDSIREKA